MGIFSRNKQVNSDEYEKLHKRLVTLEHEFEAMKTGFNSIRGMINKRLGKGALEKEEDEEDEEQTPITDAEIQRALLGFTNGKE